MIITILDIDSSLEENAVEILQNIGKNNSLFLEY